MTGAEESVSQTLIKLFNFPSKQNMSDDVQTAGAFGKTS